MSWERRPRCLNIPLSIPLSSTGSTIQLKKKIGTLSTVTSLEPLVIGKSFLSCLRFANISVKHRSRLDIEFSFFPRTQFVPWWASPKYLTTIDVTQRALNARQWITHEALESIPFVWVRDGHANLCHSIPFKQPVSWDSLPFFENRSRKGSRAWNHES